MAKKGGVQQLQADLTTDEEFEKFLQRTGLLVLDIYSEWCGPCLGMVGSLRKIKLELGGDNLQLAICKAGSISYLNRFNKKSEPTWMFVTNGKAISIMFGTDVPKLVAMITRMLQSTMAKESHLSYEITELQPIELQQLEVRNKALRQAEEIELAESRRKRLEYLHSVTDCIMANLPDIGITVFGPQVNRDMFKKLSEPADPLKIQCKDRKVFTILPSDIATVNFAAENPLAPDVIELLYEKELLMCFWKVEEVLGSPPTVLRQYAHELTKETIKPPDEFNEEEIIVPPMIVPMEVSVEIPEPEQTEEDQEHQDAHQLVDTKTENVEDGEEKASPEEVPPVEPTTVPKADQNKTKTVRIPPIWVPSDQRTHAALIYTYFRAQTSTFLPPDPVPEPPHIVMIFDAYKKKDLAILLDTCREDIPLYGFFNGENPQTAVFIANSVDKYNAKPYVPTDKIVLKVNKVSSPTIPTLMAYGPSYVSTNSVIGHKEATQFFPANYKSALQEEEELHAVKAEKPKKRKKNKKGGDPEESGKVDIGLTDTQQEADEAVKTSPEEGASTTSSGEDSCESRPATADGTNPDGTQGT
ncbi:thioredoxin domain-containing protein 3 [Drosophila eugracilis]|uniref:thioredoxin domain-containing protein 3 n=1 Tax=Drosophila eugracilis TaxID=29029 RepID=UPI0007E8004E|nr:thioredoxin domain-containing protein 3 [Drosophila eugracilis]